MHRGLPTIASVQANAADGTRDPTSNVKVCVSQASVVSRRRGRSDSANLGAVANRQLPGTFCSGSRQGVGAATGLMAGRGKASAKQTQASKCRLWMRHSLILIEECYRRAFANSLSEVQGVPIGKPDAAMRLRFADLLRTRRPMDAITRLG